MSEQLGLAGLVSPKQRQPGGSFIASHRSEMTFVPGTGNPRWPPERTSEKWESKLPSRPVPGLGRFGSTFL